MRPRVRQSRERGIVSFASASRAAAPASECCKGGEGTERCDQGGKLGLGARPTWAVAGTATRQTQCVASASRTAAQARQSGEKLKESRSNKLERVSPRLGGHQPRLRSQGCKRREGAARSPLRLKRSDSESERVTPMSRDRRRSSVLRCESQQARRRSLGCVKNCSASAVGLQKLRGAESAKEQNIFSLN